MDDNHDEAPRDPFSPESVRAGVAAVDLYPATIRAMYDGVLPRGVALVAAVSLRLMADDLVLYAMGGEPDIELTTDEVFEA